MTDLDDRLAAILERPRVRDVVAARRDAAAVCDVPACPTPRPARLFPRGYRCDATHAPAQPAHRPPLTSSPLVPPTCYGSTTGDPAGRNGDGWVKSEQTRLPRWVGDGPPVRRR